GRYYVCYFGVRTPFLIECLSSYGRAYEKRDTWHGLSVYPRTYARVWEGSTDVENFPPPSVSGKTREILGRKAGMTGRNIGYLLAVYRNRPDLFELVFDGSHSSRSTNVNSSFIPTSSTSHIRPTVSRWYCFVSSL